MTEKKIPVLVFGDVAQCRENGVLLVQNLLRAAIESTLLPGSQLTLREFLQKKVFSNGGPITNAEICAVARELFGENGAEYFGILEGRGAGDKLGYSKDEVRQVRDALDALAHAEVSLICEVPERIHTFEDRVCTAVGFRFAKHNRHHP